MSRVEANSYFSQSIATRASVSLDGGWQDASVVSMRYPGYCGIFAFCTEEGCLVARVVQRVHYVVFISALLDLLPDFPVLGIVAVVAATLVSSSPPNMLSRRRQPCAAPSIIATMRRPTEPMAKCVPAGTIRRPSKHRRHQLNSTASIINVLSCRRGSTCVAYVSASPDVPLSLHNKRFRAPALASKSFRDQYHSSCPPHIGRPECGHQTQSARDTARTRPG